MRRKPEFQNMSTAMWIQKLLDVETEVFREQPQSHSIMRLKNKKKLVKISNSPSTIESF
jgi:hypothetical protein